MTVWRVVHRRWADEAFGGAGAELLGGRFNSPGVAMVYTSESLSLAVLETLVRAGSRNRLRDFRCIPATLPREPGTLQLPDNWNAVPYRASSQQAGDAWIRTCSGLAVRVPSVVVPIEHNVLLNPRHPDFAEVHVGEPIPFPIDPRFTAPASPTG